MSHCRVLDDEAEVIHTELDDDLDDSVEIELWLDPDDDCVDNDEDLLETLLDED